MASDFNVSASHLSPQGGGFEPQRTFNWVLLLPGLPGGGDAMEMIRLSVEKAQLPRYSNSVISLRYQNENRKVAGAVSVDSNTIVVRDFVDRPVLKALQDWRAQVHDPETGSIGYASDYKKQGILQLIDPKGNIKRTITAIGIWPSSISFTDLDYTTDNAEVKVNLVLQVDRYSFTQL